MGRLEFSTPRSLERHIKKSHPGYSPSPSYRCNIRQCQAEGNIWTRADDVRRHLERVHGKILHADDDLSEFIYVTTQQPQQQAISDATTEPKDEESSVEKVCLHDPPNLLPSHPCGEAN